MITNGTTQTYAGFVIESLSQILDFVEDLIWNKVKLAGLLKYSVS